MLPKVLAAGFIMLVAGTFGVAATAIGTECYNQDTESGKKFKQDKKKNFNFLVSNLVCAILLILSGSGAMYLGVKG